MCILTKPVSKMLLLSQRMIPLVITGASHYQSLRLDICHTRCILFVYGIKCRLYQRTSKNIIIIGNACDTWFNDLSNIDIVVNKINAESHNFNINSQVNRNKIANIDSVCSAITVTALIIILIELAGKVNIVDLAVWLFILLSTFDTFNALPESMRHLHKIFFNRIYSKIYKTTHHH